MIITTEINYIIGQKNSKSYKITPEQKQRANNLLKQSKNTFSVKTFVEQDKLVFQEQAAAPPIFWLKQFHHPVSAKKYNMSLIDTRKTPLVFLFFITLTLDFLTHIHYKFNRFWINLFFSYPVPIKQPIKVDSHNISTPKLGVQDLIVTHNDCSSQHVTNMQYYKFNKIGECKIKPAFKSTLPSFNILTNLNTPSTRISHICETQQQRKLLLQNQFYKRLTDWSR